MANQIFISYSKKDKDFAWKLADDLANAGHNVWIDRSLQVGEDWEQTIEEQLAKADEVIVILSANAIASRWVQHEGSIAYGLKKRMYPVLIEEIATEDLPIWMSKFQYHSFVNVDYEISFAALNSVLTPKNPVQDLLAQKHYDYEAYKLLLEPKELEIVAAQLSNPSLELSDADKRLLLYSAVAHGLGEQWKALVGEDSLLWLREAVQDSECSSAVRTGAAAGLGTAGDRMAFDQLNQIAQEASTTGSKNDALELLAMFLLRSPVEFELPRNFRRDVFLRLARLRVKDGVTRRMHIRKAASFITPLCVMLMMISVYIQSRFSASAGNDLMSYVFVALILGILGIVVAYSFAEVMTSLMLIMRRWGLVWQIIILVGAGSLIGIVLFYILAGDHGLWFEGGIIGLVLALTNKRSSHKPRRYSGTLSILMVVLTFALSLAALTVIKEGKPVELLGSAISTGLFTGVYILASSQTDKT
jgi:hypothetical protein